MGALLEKVRAAERLPSPSLAREIRRAAGVSQADVAAELQVHVTTVSRWESGRRRPRGRLLIAYVQLLDQLRGEVRA